MPGAPGRSGGHNRKTIAARRFRGTYRSDRAPKARSVDELGAPDKPDLEGDTFASEAWDRIVSVMAALHTITPADRDAVLLAAKAESEFKRADALLLAEGLVVLTAKGTAAHPAVKIRESAWRRWSTALTLLGLQPATRERVGKANPPAQDNPFNRIRP